ncbi:MAG: TRAP transporter small permease [Deltaproteobacteria bacterium]|nr:TRAP transporter small permease [Deltaproteobacteria bacterium]
MMTKLIAVVDKVLTVFEEWTLFITVLVAMVSLFFNVILRYVFSYSLAWSEELVREVILYTTFIGCSVAVKNRSTVRIDALVQLVPVLKFPFAMLSYGVNLVFAAVMIYFGYQMCAMQVESNQSTLILQIPTVYLYATLPLMGVLMIMRLLIVMREDIILNQRAQIKR